MIGRLSGRLGYRADDHVLIDVRGVGYIVYCSDRTMAALPGVGEAVSLYTDLVVREDLMQLYGFPTLMEKEWYRLLMTVQGVGAKATLAILGALGAEGVSRAIALGDWNAVKVARGIGPKIARRIVFDLKDKAPAVMSMRGATVPSITPDATDPADPAPPPVSQPAAPQPGHAHADALSALANLGYSPSEAAAAVAGAIGETPQAEAPVLIRLALKRLATNADRP